VDGGLACAGSFAFVEKHWVSCYLAGFAVLVLGGAAEVAAGASCLAASLSSSRLRLRILFTRLTPDRFEPICRS
jgi:hypothetical protein